MIFHSLSATLFRNLLGTSCNHLGMRSLNEFKAKEKLMRHFTVFTFLYLATGVYLTVVALEHPDITSNFKTTLLFSAGISYLTAVVSTFPFWRQSALRSQARLRDKPAWLQNFTMIAPLIVIASTFFIAIPDLVNHNWAVEAIARASVGPLIILLSVEQLFIRSQIRQ